MTRLWKSSAEIVSTLLFLLIAPLLFWYEGATTLVWTVIVPLLPIIIVLVGFSNWRNICPLSTFSKVSRSLTWIEKRKVPLWLENNFYYFQFAMLFVALWLRLTVLNFSNHYLGMFFIFILISTFIVNLIYTGKSWCNYFCPVGAVEKVYCISDAKNYATSSACFTCTACKQNCPDIDMENNYWRENTNEQKSFVFYSFTGLILGFYLYFFLQSGSFTYYFSGDWTEVNLSLLSSGFFFAEFIPVFVAVPLTLVIFSFVSFFIFKGIEIFLIEKNIFEELESTTIKHRLKVISSFIAFNTFYIFAGAPSYVHYPLLYSMLYFSVVSLSTIIFYKEIFRKEDYFIQERFALKTIKKWDAQKTVHTNLKAVYYAYINENKNKKQRVQTYKDTIRDLLQEGILDENSLQILEKLHKQIGISSKDHIDVMKSIKQSNEELFDNTVEKTSEIRYQRESYKNMILDALHGHKELEIDYIRTLQQQFGITDNLHSEIMDSIFNSDVQLHHEIEHFLQELDALIVLEKSLYNDHSREIAFLNYAIKNEFQFVSNNLFSLLFIIYKDNKEILKTLANISKEKEIDDNFEFTKETLSFMDENISNNLLYLYDLFRQESTQINIDDNKTVILDLLSHPSLEIATSALLSTRLNLSQYIAYMNLDRFTHSENSHTIELVNKIIYSTHDLTTYERMMYLNSIPIFQKIRFQELILLGESTKVQTFLPQEYIIEQGGVGHTLYIIIKGSAIVEINNREINTLSDKDYFGEIALVGDTKRTVSVKAVEDITALTISKKDFKKFLDEHPKIHNQVMKNAIKKLLELQA